MSRGHYAEDLTGRRFGNYTVIGRAPNVETMRKGKIHKQAMWYCQCDCGSPIKIVRGSHLRSGKIVSCGCVRYKNSRDAKIKHNASKTRLYYVWYDMRKRCYNQNIRSFKNYGARGITVCDEWRYDFAPFMKWAIENGYDEKADYGKCTIDRIDVNGPYSPENCRWRSFKEQSQNRTNNHYVSYNGEIYTIAELAELLNINYATLSGRIRRGWRSEDLGLPTSPLPLKRRNKNERPD